MLYSFFWEIPHASEFHVPTFRNTRVVETTYEDGAECSETSEDKFQAQGNYPKE
jgi:hypothetical protein